MLGLLIAGLVTLVVGLLAIGFGIPVKEFSFGNTLIVTGVLGACTGVLLFALALVVRELKTIARALEASAGHRRDGFEPFTAQAAQVTARGSLAGGGAGIPASHPDTAALPAENPAPWQNEAGSRDRSRGLEPETAAVPPPAPPPEPAKKRRNLLFMSSKRDRAEADSAQFDAPEAPTPAPEPRVSFEDAWPAADRPPPVPPRRAGRTSDAAETENTRPAPAAPPPIRRPAEAPSVTILKSGVVDGMAYSLYSDGSIEAQMPEGMIRFASIDELRHHLDQRGA